MRVVAVSPSKIETNSTQSYKMDAYSSCTQNRFYIIGDKSKPFLKKSQCKYLGEMECTAKGINEDV